MKSTQEIMGGFLLTFTCVTDGRGSRATAQVSESCNLVPSLNMTLDEKENRTWNKKTFRGMDWMQEQNESAFQNEEAQVFYKGRTPSAKLGLKISK